MGSLEDYKDPVVIRDTSGVSVSVSTILTSLFWNRHYEDSEKLRHFKFGPVVPKYMGI